MSALTVTDTLSVPEALAVVRDILAQTDGDAVVLALRAAGPLVPREYPPGAWYRHSPQGPVGEVYHPRTTADGNYPENLYRWVLWKTAYSGPPPAEGRLGGSAASCEEADASMVAALTALGWHCVGAPVVAVEPAPAREQGMCLAIRADGTGCCTVAAGHEGPHGMTDRTAPNRWEWVEWTDEEAP